MAREKPKSRKITSVDLLVHPFYRTCMGDEWRYVRKVKMSVEDSNREAQMIANRWKDRIRVVQGNPDAVLVVLRTRLSPHAREVVPNSTMKIMDEFYGWCEKALGKPPKGRLFWEYGNELDTKGLKWKMKQRGFSLARTPHQPKVWAYGEHWKQCVRNNFREFLREFRIPFNIRRTKIVHSLSLGEHLDRITELTFRRQGQRKAIQMALQDHEQIREQLLREDGKLYKGYRKKGKRRVA